MILYALADGVPYSQKQICDEWGIPRTTVNTIIKDWEKKGLVSLSPIPGKRREMNILLTAAGQNRSEHVDYSSFHIKSFCQKPSKKRFPDVSSLPQKTLLLCVSLR